jgi:hypothetical protein
MPTFGYSTALWDPPTWEAYQERIGDTQVIASGFLTAGTAPLIRDFAGIPGVSASIHEGAELLATNSGEFDAGFVICTKCGFADSMRTAADDLPRSAEGVEFAEHLPLRMKRGGKKCWAKEEEPVMRHQHLAAQLDTDLLEVDLENAVGLTTRIMATTFAHAHWRRPNCLRWTCGRPVSPSMTSKNRLHGRFSSTIPKPAARDIFSSLLRDIMNCSRRSRMCSPGISSIMNFAAMRASNVS